MHYQEKNAPGKFEQNLENHNISIRYQVFRLNDIIVKFIIIWTLLACLNLPPLAEG